jgi:ATP-dependent RNA circularization protein (DNA/RNA ligase family)
VESISEVKRGGRVMEKSKLVFTSYETLELFKQHLKLQGLDFKLEIAGERDGKITVILERIMRGTTDKITGILNGNLWR